MILLIAMNVTASPKSHWPEFCAQFFSEQVKCTVTFSGRRRYANGPQITRLATHTSNLCNVHLSIKQSFVCPSRELQTYVARHWDLHECTPIVQLWRWSAYILVLLPLMARWHSSDDFGAELMLWQSKRFDYSAPQFFHESDDKNFYSSYRRAGRLNLLDDLVFRCEFERLPAHYVQISVQVHLSTYCIVQVYNCTLYSGP